MATRSERLTVRTDELREGDLIVFWGKVEKVGEPWHVSSGSIQPMLAGGRLSLHPTDRKWLIEREVEVPESVTVESAFSGRFTVDVSRSSAGPGEVWLMMYDAEVPGGVVSPGRLVKAADLRAALDELGV